MDEALCAPSSDVPHLTDPAGWLEAEGEYIIKILQDIAAIVEDDAIVDLLGDAAKIAFPRLMVYTLAHLMFCGNDDGALEGLKKYTAEWHTMGAISRLENHLVIKDWLFDLCGTFQISLTPTFNQALSNNHVQ
ncbi:hypothetical protein FIBSPDRAFT_1038558 [Athelia psychrophila]|uniref:Uncharacterized protein n=1 Tax=Athelia psychrophila TaxID=1759441 RepID=A0A166SUD4_9AGAM|nr:hypothetical protein FIBSPDRAFT_1038558 [Fibularhizoctonia sp. CBS 109695]